MEQLGEYYRFDNMEQLGGEQRFDNMEQLGGHQRFDKTEQPKISNSAEEKNYLKQIPETLNILDFILKLYNLSSAYMSENGFS